MKTIRWLIPLVVSLGLLAVLIGRWTAADGGGAVTARLAEGRFLLAFLGALLVTTVGYLLLGAVRWRLLLAYSGAEVPFPECLRLWLTTAAFDVAVPAGAGKLLAAPYLLRARAVPLALTASTILCKKYLNLLSALLFIAGAGAWRLITGSDGARWEALVTAGAAAATILLVLMQRLAGRGRALSGRPGRGWAVLVGLLGSFGLSVRQTLVVLSLSLVGMAARVAAAWLVLVGLGLAVDPSSLLFHYPAITVLAGLPVTISGIGLRETLVVGLFAMPAAMRIWLLGGAVLSTVEVVFPAAVGLIVLAGSPRYLARAWPSSLARHRPD